MSDKVKNILVIVLVAACIMSIGMYVKASNAIIRDIVWNYEVTEEAFSKAADMIDEGKADNLEVIKQVADNAYVPVWQNDKLELGLTLSRGWVSNELYMYMIDCHNPEDLNDEERELIALYIPKISDELSRADWEKIRQDNSWKEKKSLIHDTIDSIDGLLAGYGEKRGE